MLGCLAGLAFLWWLLAGAGMPTRVVSCFLPLYFIMCLVISRLRAQLGPPTHQLYGAMPNWILPTVAGTRALGPRTMGMFFLLRPFLQEQRNHPVAFPIAIAWTIQSMTAAIFATWLVKSLLLRYGGLRAHRTALPFFLGLLVGDATISLLRAVLFELLDIRV